MEVLGLWYVTNLNNNKQPENNPKNNPKPASFLSANPINVVVCSNQLRLLRKKTTRTFLDLPHVLADYFRLAYVPPLFQPLYGNILGLPYYLFLYRYLNVKKRDEKRGDDRRK